MTLAGWIFMAVSWTVIIGIFSFCLSRTLRPRVNDSRTNESEAELIDEETST
jgi:hypothetical protein